MEKMGEKSRRKMKVGRAATKAAAALSEGNQKLSAQYYGAEEVNPLNHVLLYFGGEVREDKNGGYKGSAHGGMGCRSVII